MAAELSGYGYLFCLRCSCIDGTGDVFEVRQLSSRVPLLLKQGLWTLRAYRRLSVVMQGAQAGYLWLPLAKEDAL